MAESRAELWYRQASSRTGSRVPSFVEAFCYPAETSCAVDMAGEALARRNIFKKVSSLAKKNAASG